MPVRHLPASDIAAIFDPAELAACKADPKATLTVLLAAGSVAVTAQTLAQFQTVFPAGSATSNALVALWGN